MQSVQVCSKTEETETEDPGKDGRCSRLSLKVFHGLAQLGDDLVDHFASAGVGVSRLDVLLALDGLFVKFGANFADSSGVISVVIVVRSAGDAVVRNQRLGGERVSVVVLFVSSLWCLLGASGISENSSVDTRGSAVSSSVEDFVAASVVVVLVFFVHGSAFAEFLHVNFLLCVVALVLNAKGGSLGSKAGVQAIVVVVTVTAGIARVVDTVLAVVLACFFVGLAFVFLSFLNGLLVSFDEVSQLDNVFSASSARSTAVAWADLELGDHVGAESFFSLEHGDGFTPFELERATADPGANRRVSKRKEAGKNAVRKEESKVVD